MGGQRKLFDLESTTDAFFDGVPCTELEATSRVPLVVTAIALPTGKTTSLMDGALHLPVLASS